MDYGATFLHGCLVSTKGHRLYSEVPLYRSIRCPQTAHLDPQVGLQYPLLEVHKSYILGTGFDSSWKGFSTTYSLEEYGDIYFRETRKLRQQNQLFIFVLLNMRFQSNFQLGQPSVHIPENKVLWKVSRIIWCLARSNSLRQKKIPFQVRVLELIWGQACAIQNMPPKVMSLKTGAG